MTMFNSFLDTVSDKIGNLSSATTTDKSSVVAMVNEVNEKIGNIIDISSDIIVDSHITLNNNNFTLQKIGKMIFVNLMFTTTAEISANTKLIDNIPYSPLVNSQSIQVFKQGSKDAYIVGISRNTGTNTCYITTLDTIPKNTSVRSVLSIPVGA